MMTKATLNTPKWVGLLGALVVFVISGLFHVGYFRFGAALQHASYDWNYVLAHIHSTAPSISEVIIVYLDEPSHKELQQDFNKPWSRSLHAELVRKLTAAGAKAVVFDVLFSDPGYSAKEDQDLEQAIRANGRVVLATDWNITSITQTGQEAYRTQSITLPYDPFLKATANWGLAQLQPDEDFAIREHYHGEAEHDYVSLSWAVARQLGLPLTSDPEQRLKERWYHYYGPPDTIPHLSYVLARSVPDHFFRDKIVLIGARPMAGSYRERRDEYRSPYSSFYREPQFMPAVEIHATALLNLLRGDWLTRLSPVVEWGILLAVSLGFGYGLASLRLTMASTAAVAGITVTTVLSLLLFAFGRVWFPWLLVVLIQIPAAWLISILWNSYDWYVQRRGLERERQQAELKIRQQAALLDQAQDAIYVQSLEWQISFWNKGAERLYGWTAAEMLQHSIWDVPLHTDKPVLLEAQQQVLAKGEWVGQLTQTIRAGREVNVTSHWSLVYDDAGKPAAVLVTNTDITELKQWEHQYYRAQRMESIGTLAGGIAHDLNNMLSPIMMAVELFRDKCQESRDKRLLDMMSGSAKRAADLVKQVLSFARGHEGEHTVLQLTHVIKEMDKFIRETFPKSIKVNSQIGAQLMPVSGDATQLHQVLLNLCVNARDAMPDGGELCIEADHIILDDQAASAFIEGRAGQFVCLRVSDTGTGIPPEIRERIFEPFFTTKEVGKGTGLGLATVSSIVKGHQGFMDLKSEVGKGTAFTIYLPAVANPVTQSTVAAGQAPLSGKGETILLVDDELAIREVAGTILRRRGYQVHTAKDGQEALSFYQRQPDQIHVVIVDMMMPGMDGLSTIKAIKQIRSEVRFIVASGVLQSDSIKEQVDQMGGAFLRKPFEVDKLLHTLRWIMNPQPQAARGQSVATGRTRGPNAHAALSEP